MSKDKDKIGIKLIELNGLELTELSACINDYASFKGLIGDSEGAEELRTLHRKLHDKWYYGKCIGWAAYDYLMEGE